MDTLYELNIIDNITGDYYDTVGEYSALYQARESRDSYLLENPDEKYSIVRVTREIIE